MTLSTMEPNPVWGETTHEDAVDALAAADVTVHVWGADWCGDCRAVLPDFAAAVEAAGLPDDRVHVHEVDRDKDGDLVAEYGVEYVPTIVLERDGEELARFVESEPVDPVEYLADRLD